MEQPFEKLAQAIVVQAAKDYVSATRNINKYKLDDDRTIAQKKLKQETELFFLSGWFGILTNLDGEDLLEMLRKETSHDIVNTYNT